MSQEEAVNEINETFDLPTLSEVELFLFITNTFLSLDPRLRW